MGQPPCRAQSQVAIQGSEFRAQHGQRWCREWVLLCTPVPRPGGAQAGAPATWLEGMWVGTIDGQSWLAVGSASAEASAVPL